MRKLCLRKRKVSDAAESSATKRHRERYCHNHDLRNVYCRNIDVQTLKCKRSKLKYSSNVHFQNLVYQYSKVKYKRNLGFQARVREYSKDKYLRNPACKSRVCEYSKDKYLRNPAFKSRKCMDVTIARFRQEVSKGPEFVCCVCHRLFFRKQVTVCQMESYEEKGERIVALASRCITLNYVHVCDETCNNSPDSFPGWKLWICPTCHRKLLYGKLPAESIANMHLVDIPNQLKCLNSLEEHLIARNIHFLKLLCLPRGKQHGCHGPVVLLQLLGVADVSNILPRNECDDKLISIKLKRKLTYKGHYEYKYVHTDRVKDALKYLIRYNKWYKDIEINEQWINSLDELEEIVVDDKEMEEQDVQVEKTYEENDTEEQPEEDLTYIKEQGGLLSDTSLQPVDIGSEIIDQHFRDVLNVAPAEGNSPVRLLADETNEAKCFPILFPTSGPTFHDDREVRITLSRNLNARILNADGRFARITDLIFYAQYLSELDQILSNVSIALRKGSDKSLLQEVRSEVLTDPNSLTKILNYDEGYKFLRPVRGTPPYWQTSQKDLFALIRQLGIPTFFASFKGKNVNVDELDWSEKCGLICRNPVTAARMFDHRWHCFLKDVIMSPAEPIGKVKDYFYRVEFQQRGSPHVHCLFWVEDAPKHDDREVRQRRTTFIDRYITCEIPREDDGELYETANSVQKHSVRHSKTCRKKNTVCRFNFPRPPSGRTFITRAVLNYLKSNDKHDTASAILKKIKSALTDSDVVFDSTDAFFQSIGINQSVFEKACKICSKKKSVVLKRNPNDVWVNQYNTHLLCAWKGNMDIQTDAYSVVMGLLLQRAQNEAMNGNLEARSALKMLGSVYLHNREISAQEAVYRLTGMHLKECSRKVQFIPIGTDPVKMSLPLRILQNRDGQRCEESSIWMKSLVDRYKSRLQTQQFDILCLASFCSEHRILSLSEISSQTKSSKDKVIKLNNNCGYMMKRTRTEPVVVRYPRFLPTKDPVKYHYSLLQLFLPHYEDWQLKPDSFSTYEDFYNDGAVKCGSDVATVKSIVDANRALFEKVSHVMERAQQLLEQGVDLEDTLALQCPETEKQHDECLELKKKKTLPDEDDSDVLIPDLMANPQASFTIDTNNAVIDILQNSWCLQKLLGENHEQFYLFVTGGAGTGKSHLIKAIYYESSRLLSQLSENPDDRSVTLCVSTGVAAYNIGAATIHNTLSIGANVKLPYQPLINDKINYLHCKMGSLLRQFKQTGDYSVFGKVSIVAVGDFYQLPPVRGIPLYSDTNGVNLWHNNFEIAELTKVVRQQNAWPLILTDIKMLKQCETGEACDAIHIFPTNAEVDEYNAQRHNEACPEAISIRKNIDVSDDLVNGAFGTVVHVSRSQKQHDEDEFDDDFPSAIHVVVDNPNVGKTQRSKQTLTLRLISKKFCNCSAPVKRYVTRLSISNCSTLLNIKMHLFTFICLNGYQARSTPIIELKIKAFLHWTCWFGPHRQLQSCPHFTYTVTKQSKLYLQKQEKVETQKTDTPTHKTLHTHNTHQHTQTQRHTHTRMRTHTHTTHTHTHIQ
ncbi:hypothetical protein IRJ41_003612 [Triplophysa rosa]|uniref:DNA helicase n=1 Tax=Triplophysa rosa TaxID=992332 RepID=A0A9W7T4C3_TRIRA|nr:hypothetical protein IRJ41_003612 [Triplophysa rosa]